MEPNVADIGILVNKYSGNIHDIEISYEYVYVFGGWYDSFLSFGLI